MKNLSKSLELTRDVIGELVDLEEKSLDESRTFDRGTVLTVIRGAHPWGSLTGMEYCTVQIGGEYFNILAPILQKSMQPKV